ncbi:MAG: transcriptional repressor [Bryobacteraceae bacterium]|nr:transcriptional repressor [Bryobacteraceae bacterium]
MAPASIKETVRKRGIRLTRQRQILLDVIDETGLHLDAERLYALASAKDPKLNRVTVYRTIKMLKDAGLVDELDLMHWSGDQHYYETRMKQEHAHVVCMRCGKVQEYYGAPLGQLRRKVEGSLGFKVLTVRTEIGGYCAECQAHGEEADPSLAKETARSAGRMERS